VTDGPKKRSAHDEFESEMEMQKAVEDGIDVVSDAMRQLLTEPEETRAARLETLIAQVRAFADKLDAAGDKSEAQERAKAVERVIEILQHMMDKKKAT
jgi:hypothetical protein